MAVDNAEPFIYLEGFSGSSFGQIEIVAGATTLPEMQPGNLAVMFSYDSCLCLVPCWPKPSHAITSAVSATAMQGQRVTIGGHIIGVKSVLRRKHKSTAFLPRAWKVLQYQVIVKMSLGMTCFVCYWYPGYEEVSFYISPYFVADNKHHMI